MKRIFSILLCIGILIIPISADAGIFGILRGKVKDADGKPLASAIVRVNGTNRGANTKLDGTYQISNLSAGKYEIQVTYIQKDTAKATIIISADKITEQDFIVGDKTAPTIIVTANKVNMGAVGSGSDIGTREATSIAGTGGNLGILSFSAGVVSSGSGFEIRGARASESSNRLDGIDIGNQFSGGVGTNGASYYPAASAFATEETQVLTGGFGAEYGEATGGITNSVLKTGRTDRYEGFLVYNTDLSSLNGSQASGLLVQKVGNDVKAVETGQGAKLQGKGMNNIEFGFGGYVPGVKGLTFYLSGVNKTEKYRNASYKILDPLGNNLGLLDNTGVWIKQITARMKYNISDDIDLVLGGNFGLTSYENGGWAWLYATDPGIINGVSNGITENKAKQQVTNQVVNSAFARINHRLDDETNYEIKLSMTVNNDENGRRVSSGSPSYFSGFDIMQPVDVHSPGKDGKFDSIPDPNVQGKSIERGKNRAMDIYEGYFGSNSRPFLNPLTGYYEGVEIRNGTKNAYGIENIFVTHGNGGGFQFREGRVLQLDGFFEKTLVQTSFKHLIKTGFELRTYEMNRFTNANPESSSPINYDIYTSHRNANTSLFFPDYVQEIMGKPKTPFRGSVYIQDQIASKGNGTNFSDIVFTPGIRVDYFNPNDIYRIDPTTWHGIEDTKEFAKAAAKVYVAPRMNVTYPVTESSSLVINYGVYYKMPELTALYDYSNVYGILFGQVGVGNPNVKAQKTNQYNLQYKNKINQDFIFTASVYYNDIFNQLGYLSIAAVPQPYSLVAISEYGNNKGVELEIRKYENDNFGFRLNYTLAFANGTASSAGSNVNVVNDPFSGRYAIPLAEFALSRDVRHRINYIFNLFSLDGEGPNIAGSHPLENMQLNLSGNYASGTPYTRTLVGSGLAAGSINAERNPSTFSSNIRLTKSFQLSDMLGDMAAKSSIDIYLDVFNWMNLTPYTSVNTATGNPIDDGLALQKQKGGFQANPYYKEGTQGIPETYNNQYDSFGNRLYNANSDYDKNGVTTLEERYKSYLQFQQDNLSFKSKYQTPRQVYIGIIFRF